MIIIYGWLADRGCNWRNLWLWTDYLYYPIFTVCTPCALNHVYWIIGLRGTTTENKYLRKLFSFRTSRIFVEWRPTGTQKSSNRKNLCPKPTAQSLDFPVFSRKAPNKNRAHYWFSSVPWRWYVLANKRSWRGPLIDGGVLPILVAPAVIFCKC